MSMLKVAKYLYFSKSIDLSHEEERFFNLSMVNSGHLFSCLNAKKSRRDLSPACVRKQVIEERLPTFGQGK
jgi:hypothetical protein